MVDPVPEAVTLNQMNKRMVAQYCDNGTNTVDPSHHCGVDTEQRPKTLQGSKFIGDFAKTNGGSHKTDKIKRLKKTHPIGIAR